jgi:hypothetical protein
MTVVGYQRDAPGPGDGGNKNSCARLVAVPPNEISPEDDPSASLLKKAVILSIVSIATLMIVHRLLIKKGSIELV